MPVANGHIVYKNENDPCYVCEAVEEELAGKRSRIVQATKSLVAATRGDKIDAPHVAKIFELFLGVFNGSDDFVRQWKLLLDEMIVANQEGPAKGRLWKLIMDQFWAIAKLSIPATEHRMSAPDIPDMTDEELEAELTRLVTKHLEGELAKELEYDGS